MCGYIDAKLIVLNTLSTCKDVALTQVPAMVDLGSIHMQRSYSFISLRNSAQHEREKYNYTLCGMWHLTRLCTCLKRLATKTSTRITAQTNFIDCTLHSICISDLGDYQNVNKKLHACTLACSVICLVTTRSSMYTLTASKTQP